MRHDATERSACATMRAVQAARPDSREARERAVRNLFSGPRRSIGKGSVPVTCDEAREALELYVAGALTADETRAVEAHAASCPGCRDDLAALSAVTVGLARSVPQVEPGAAVRARVLRAASPRVEQTPGTPRRFAPDRTGWIAAAALALLSLWLGADSLKLRHQVTALQSELADARARVDASDAQVARLQSTAARNAQAMTVLTAPDLARVDLAGQPPSPDARARAFWSRSRGLVFSASRLPALPRGRTYQLWVVTAAAPVSVGLLEPDEAGRADAVFITPPDLATPIAMAVTEEPAGGVPAPTGQKYLVGVPAAGAS